MGERATTERCLRLIDRGLRERGYDGRSRYRYLDDGISPLRLIALRRHGGRFTMGLNFVPRALLRAWTAVDHWWVATDIHDKGDTANLAFWDRLFTLAERYDPGGGWREVERADQVQPMAEQVLALFDRYGEPWFGRLADARLAVEALSGWYMSQALPMEAAILLAETPTLRCLEVADSLADFATADPDEQEKRFGSQLTDADVRVWRWLAAELRHHAGDDNGSLADLLNWPSRAPNFYSTPAQVRAQYEAAKRQVLADMGAVELDPNLLNRRSNPRRSAKRDGQEPK